MVKLKRLKIHHYRNIRPGTELHFDNGINLVLGQNGAGKTTLLALLSHVISSNFSALEGEPFDLEYDLTGGDFSAHVHLRTRSNDSEASFQPRAQAQAFEYDLEITNRDTAERCEVRGSHEGTELRVAGESQPRTTPPSTLRFFFFESLVGLHDVPGFTKTFDSLYVFIAARFDESLDSFLAMTGRHSVSAGSGAPPVARLSVLRPPSHPDIAFSMEFAPGNLASLVPVAHDLPAGEIRISTVGAPDLEHADSSLKFLVQAATAMGFTAAALKPEIKTIRNGPAKGSQRFDVEGFSFNFTRRDGTTIHHDLLSYGQKRLLAYYYYLAATDHVVIADELVNGLHHRWIEACMDAIGERQAFLTSQNPLLFEYVDFKSIEHVQSCFITCKSELVDGAEQLVWHNMPREDAITFFRAYEADIEGVGDILINRGLW